VCRPGGRPCTAADTAPRCHSLAFAWAFSDDTADNPSASATSSAVPGARRRPGVRQPMQRPFASLARYGAGRAGSRTLAERATSLASRTILAMRVLSNKIAGRSIGAGETTAFR